MVLGFDEILSHRRLPAAMRSQSRTLVDLHDGAPRLAAVFATQQRWLLAHVGLALHFRAAGSGFESGFVTARYLDVAEKEGVASRNTADAFLKEMVAYGFVHPVQGVDRRGRPLAPSDTTLALVAAWLSTHLATLDMLDGSDRQARFAQDPARLGVIQPLIADALLANPSVREPPSTFSLFTWLNNGGVVMDWLIAGMDDLPLDAPRVATSMSSTVEMAERCRLSRTHLARKLREAELLGSIGWEGARGRSRLWVSRDFRHEYASAQAVKLAAIDAAFQAATGA
jgi:hypothetical protein